MAQAPDAYPVSRELTHRELIDGLLDQCDSVRQRASGHLDSPAAFLIYGIGGLAVPLALLFLWLRLRNPHPSGSSAVRGN